MVKVKTSVCLGGGGGRREAWRTAWCSSSARGGEDPGEVAYYVCNSVHSVMRKMLLAAECGVLGGDIFTRLCLQLYSKLAVCVVSWLASTILGG